MGVIFRVPRLSISEFKMLMLLRFDSEVFFDHRDALG